jgi:DNA-binding SARP family transcriptional activator
MTAHFRLTVFGGLRLFVDGAEAELGPPRQRAVFAMFVAARGETVALAELTDALWTGDAPGSAANQLHRIVGGLRRLLQPALPPRASGDYLRANGTGYVLDLRDIDSELEQFIGLVELSRKAESTQRAGVAIEALTLAAATPFAGLPVGLVSLPMFAGIRQLRLSLCSIAVDGVRAGSARFEDVLPLVERIAAGEPLDESLQASYMRLLQLAGRRSDAIDVFERTRKQLAENLGIDPGAELRAAHLEILTDTDSGQAATPTDAPHELPPTIAGFVARAELSPLLADATSAAVDGTGSIAILSGMGGIGKTTLAINWATSVTHQFPDGQLYVNLLGFDLNREPLSAQDALRQLLEQLGATPSDEGVAALSAQYRGLIAHRRLVILLDNARETDQVRPLLAGVPGCLTIVTSRNRLAGLAVRDGARTIPLGRWSAAQSLQLLTARLGLHRATEERAAVDSIVETCAGLPLALAIAAARSTFASEAGVPGTAQQLAVPSRVLDSLTAGDDDDLRSTFAWSYQALSAETARMFRHLAAHPGPRISVWSLATCADRPLAEARRLVAALVSANMANDVAVDTVEIHDLLRVYADELLAAEGEHGTADRRMVEHYVRSARAAFLVYDRPPTVDLPYTGTVPDSIERFSSPQDSVEWYD